MLGRALLLLSVGGLGGRGDNRQKKLLTVLYYENDRLRDEANGCGEARGPLSTRALSGSQAAHPIPQHCDLRLAFKPIPSHHSIC